MTVEVGTIPVPVTPTGDEAQVVAEDDYSYNRTQRPTDFSDPLDLSTPVVPEEEAPPEPEVPEVPVEEPPSVEEETKPEEVPEEELVKARQEVGGHLDKILEEKTGVGLDGVVEAITTLLSWYNDILSLEANQTPVQESPVPNRSAPQFQRSKGREALPTQASYDFRRSQILSMSPEEYERNAQAITVAWQRGRVLNDL